MLLRSDIKLPLIASLPEDVQAEILDIAFEFPSLPSGLGIGIEFSAHSLSKAQQMGVLLGMFLTEKLALTQESLSSLLLCTIDIYNNYLNMPYHSSDHAIDVAYMTYYLMNDISIAEHVSLNPLEIAVLLISALGHDVLHTGRSNAFEKNRHTDISILYNGVSILENQSSLFVRQTIQKHNLIYHLNFARNQKELPSDNNVEKQILDSIHECIIKTDMIHHFALLNTLVEFADYGKNEETDAGKLYSCNSSSNMLLHVELNTPAMRQDMLNIILHAADISNPTRPFNISKKWSDLILKEFRAQAETEIRLGLPCSFPDTIYNQPRTQIQFTNIIVQPFFEALCELFPRVVNMLDFITDNAKDWEALLLKEEGETGEAFNVLGYKKTTNFIEEDECKSRNVSIAAGTIQISESLEKYLEGIDLQTSRTSIQNLRERKFSLAKTMLKAMSLTLGQGHSETNIRVTEENQNVIS